MKIMKYKWMAAGAVAIMTATTVHATSVVGSIGIDADTSTAVTIDQSANTVSFTPGAPTANAVVNQASGSFLGLLNDSVVYNNFSYDPLSITGGNPIWHLVGGAASFDLLTITSVVESSGGLLLQGTGTIHLTGFDNTFGFWSFSANSTSPGVFNWASTATAAPDGGTTVMLLGAGLSGLALIRRKLA